MIILFFEVPGVRDIVFCACRPFSSKIFDAYFLILLAFE